MNELNPYSDFYPHSILRIKYMLIVITILTPNYLGLFFFPDFIEWVDNEPLNDAVYKELLTYAAITLLALGLLFSYFYYPTIHFSLTNEEINVNRGLITKSNKIVPYRTITNIDIKRGLYDRLFGIGSIEIQTAGFSAGKQGPEERIDGVPREEIEHIRALIMKRVRSVKGSPGTSQDVDMELNTESDILNAILYEIKELRKSLTK